MAAPEALGCWFFGFCMEVIPLLINIDSRPLETDVRPSGRDAARSRPRRQRKAVDAHPFFSTSFLPLRNRWYLPCKAAAEFVIALGLAVLTAPLLFLAAALVKLTSRGPAFYTQTRVG